MTENLFYAQVPLPYKSTKQDSLETGSDDKIVKHLEREMEFDGLEADESLVKTQMTVNKKDQPAGN